MADASAEVRQRQHELDIVHATFWPENPGQDFFTGGEWEKIGQALDLSERELSVAMLIFEGRSRDEIADRLHKSDGKSLSSDTVRVYIDRLYEKARVSDRLGLVIRVLRVHRALCEQTSSQ